MRLVLAALLFASAFSVPAWAEDQACRHPRQQRASHPPKVHYRTYGYGRF